MYAQKVLLAVVAALVLLVGAGVAFAANRVQDTHTGGGQQGGQVAAQADSEEPSDTEDADEPGDSDGPGDTEDVDGSGETEDEDGPGDDADEPGDSDRPGDTEDDD